MERTPSVLYRSRKKRNGGLLPGSISDIRYAGQFLLMQSSIWLGRGYRILQCSPHNIYDKSNR